MQKSATIMTASVDTNKPIKISTYSTLDSALDINVHHQQIPNLMYTYVQCCTDVTVLWQGHPCARHITVATGCTAD